MNTEQAMQEIAHAIGQDCLLEYPSDKALMLALAALREKAERDKGCEYCRTGMPDSERHVFDFCPICGRKLEGRE